MAGAYRSESRSGERNEVLDSLEAYVREGASRMLAAALEAEVSSSSGVAVTPEGSSFGGIGTAINGRAR